DGSPDLDQGLLASSEIATLKLNADWIILSACNTASGIRGDAETLSGLGRAFLFSGARTLLVSHWQVASYSAVRLTSQTVSMVAGGRVKYPAEALRQAMVSLMNDPSKPANGYPWIWAPFTVVGASALKR